MDQRKLADLIKRYKSGLATPEEIVILEKIWNSSSEDSSFTADHNEAELEDIRENMFKGVKSEILKHERTVRMHAYVL
jgi:transmembrane sensor